MSQTVTSLIFTTSTNLHRYRCRRRSSSFSEFWASAFIFLLVSAVFLAMQNSVTSVTTSATLAAKLFNTSLITACDGMGNSHQKAEFVTNRHKTSQNVTACCHILLHLYFIDYHSNKRRCDAKPIKPRTPQKI